MEKESGPEGRQTVHERVELPWSVARLRVRPALRRQP